MKISMRSGLKACVGMMACAAAAPAFAQEETGNLFETGEIVVTAQKREEAARDVPLSISALSGEKLERRNITDAVALSFAVPNLAAYQVSPGQNFLSIRGVSGFRGPGALVGTYLDETSLSGGIRLSDGSGLDVQAIDLARVEVLKGPQGTLFGEGSIGGVIRYVTNEPELGRVEGSVGGTLYATDGGDASGDLTAILNVPLGDKVAIRFAGKAEKAGGWIENISTGVKNYNDSNLVDVRAKLLFVPTERLEISALVDIHRAEYDGQNIVNQTPASRSLFKQAVDASFSTAGYADFNLYNVTASYDFDFATLLSSTSHYYLKAFNASGWVNQIVKGNPATDALVGTEIYTTPQAGRQKTTTQELRLTSNGNGPLKWLIGGSYKSTKNNILPNETDILQVAVLPGVPGVIPLAGGGLYQTRTDSEAYAGFADGSYTFFDRLEIGGGVRYFRERRTNDVFDTGTDNTIQDVSAVFKKTTYRAFASFKVSPSVNIYANTATGFRSGGFNGASDVAAGAPLSYGPENSIFYEAGMKSSFLNGRVRADIALFKGKYKDQLQDIIDFTDVTNTLQYTTNVGEAEIKGLEFSLNVSPARGLSLGASGVFMDTKFTKVSPLAPMIVGDPIDIVPEFDLVLSADYEFDWGADVPGFISLNSSWKGPSQYTNRDSGLGEVVSRTKTLNFVQASMGGTYNGFEVTLFVRNLTNEKKVLIDNFVSLSPQARPRQIGLGLKKTF